jgi:cyclopropane fatty-acyl-phospholipid synthase-like methyltransferase
MDKLVEPPLSISTRVRSFVKWLLFPGLDLLTRCRYRFLPTFFEVGPLLTLDAGCGNGALSYAAYRLGNTVLGVTDNEGEVRRNRQFFACRGIAARDLAFVKLNLYDLPQLLTVFDQIICSETLEHVAEDELVLRYLNGRLKPGGVLHLCSPYALHPLNNLGRVHEPEDGRHVRDGYTPDAYLRLLEAAGFEIVASAGVGGPIAVTLDNWIGRLRTRFGDVVALPLFLLVVPLSWLDTLDPQMPFSLYVKAIKRRDLQD